MSILNKSVRVMLKLAAFSACFCVGNVYAWGIREEVNSCMLTSETASARKDGIELFGASFVFEYRGKRSENGSSENIRYDLESGMLHLTFPYMNQDDFGEGDRVVFNVMDEYQGGIVKAQMRGLKKIYYFSLAGDAAMAILEGLARPASLFQAMQKRQPAPSREEVRAVVDLNNSTSLRLEAITHDGKLVRVEVPANWVGEYLPSFNACIDKVASAEAFGSDVQKIGKKNDPANWIMIPLFGAHVRLPENCEIYEKEIKHGRVMYLCDRRGQHRNVVGSWITIGAVKDVADGYLNRIIERKVGHDILCGMDVFSYKDDKTPMHLVMSRKDYMILGDVDRENIPLILQPVCDRAARDAR